jgi:hypothetical protein
MPSGLEHGMLKTKKAQQASMATYPCQLVLGHVKAGNAVVAVVSDEEDVGVWQLHNQR